MAKGVSSVSLRHILVTNRVVVVLLSCTLVHVVLHLRRSAHSLLSSFEQVHLKFLNSYSVCLDGLLLVLRDLNEVAVVVGGLLRGHCPIATRQLSVASILISFLEDIVGNPSTSFVFPERLVVAILN